MNIQNRDNFFTADAHAVKKIKILRSCSRFKTIPQLYSAIEIVSVVVTIEQQTIFRSDLLFLFNNLNIFLKNSNSFIRVQVRKNDRVLSPDLKQPDRTTCQNTSCLSARPPRYHKQPQEQDHEPLLNLGSTP